MNTTQSSRVSVVEIPLLADFIIQNLSHDDLWNCAQVSSLWREIFEPHQWRHVSLINKEGTPFFQSLSKVERTRIVQHAGRIRNLKVNFGDKHLDQLKCPKLETLIFALGRDEWNITDWSSVGFEAINEASTYDGIESEDVDMDDNSGDENNGGVNDTTLAVAEANANMISLGVNEPTLEVATAEDMMNMDVELGGEDQGGEGTNNDHVVANLEEGAGIEVNGVILDHTPNRNRSRSRGRGGAWSLLDRTPGLLTLHLPLGKYTPDLRSRLLLYFDSISNSIHTNKIRHLAHLTLEFYNNAGVDEIAVLKHLPESLHSIDFRVYPSQYSSSNLTRRARGYNHIAEAALSPRRRKELCLLRSLSLTRISLYADKLHDFGSCEVLIWFLRQCPQLRDLSLPSLSLKSDCQSLFRKLVRHCPKLERLRLNMKVESLSPHRSRSEYFRQDQRTTFESQFFSMLAPLALKSLSIDIGNDKENVTLQTLEKWSKDSLEELQLVRSGPMEESEFEKIRSTYPKLNRITYWKGSQDSEPKVNED